MIVNNFNTNYHTSMILAHWGLKCIYIKHSSKQSDATTISLATAIQVEVLRKKTGEYISRFIMYSLSKSTKVPNNSLKLLF